ncbi:hypothetical protein SAMN02910456_00629 [Ruminococcaceae bacterium YRB3002]|nr:hypothetical protein SAMN02910456_00629 [Ruminococcaceae bacterium YRB3002]
MNNESAYLHYQMVSGQLPKTQLYPVEEYPIDKIPLYGVVSGIEDIDFFDAAMVLKHAYDLKSDKNVVEAINKNSFLVNYIGDDIVINGELSYKVYSPMNTQNNDHSIFARLTVDESKIESCEYYIDLIYTYFITQFDEYKYDIERFEFRPFDNERVKKHSLSVYEEKQSVIEDLFSTFRQKVSGLFNSAFDEEQEEDLQMEVDIDALSKASNDFQKKSERVDEHYIEARYFVCSINVIYLFEYVLGIINSTESLDKSVHNKLKIYEQKMKAIRKHIDRALCRNLDLGAIDLEEYRNLVDIDFLLIEKEKNQNEKEQTEKTINLINSSFKAICKLIDEKRIHDALLKLSSLRDKVNESVGEGISDHIIGIIEQNYQITNKLLIERSDDKSVKYQKANDYIKQILGENYSLVPVDSLKILITAECLFLDFSDLSDNDFEYSGISLLYFQAVESLFNVLIWNDYSSNLKGIIINEKPFVNLYVKSDFDNETSYYLPTDSKRFYLDKGNIVDNCMLGTCAHLLKKVFNKETRGFADFFAKKMNYEGADDLYSLQGFYTKMGRMKEIFFTAAALRNKSAHGREHIDYMECKSNRELILGGNGQNEGLLNHLFKFYKK